MIDHHHQGAALIHPFAYGGDLFVRERRVEWRVPIDRVALAERVGDDQNLTIDFGGRAFHHTVPPRVNLGSCYIDGGAIIARAICATWVIWKSIYPLN